MGSLHVATKGYRETGRYLHLLFSLVNRDISVRYRRSFLGPAWAVLQPLILMVLFNMIQGFVKIPSEGVPYIIFSYSALVPWTFFSNAVTFCGPSITNNAAILKKMALPKEIFPLAAVITALFDFIIASSILVVMMVWFDVPITCQLFWIIPLTLLLMLLAFSLGMLIAATGTFKRDVIFATPFLMQFLLYATPVMYSLQSVPERYRLLYSLNPAVGIIDGFRNVLIHGQPPQMEPLFFSVCMTLLLLFVSWPVFRRVSQYFSDMM